VSGTPLMPVRSCRNQNYTWSSVQILLSQARGIVKNGRLDDPVLYQEELADRIRRMNQLFLTGARLEPEIRYSRWSPPGRTSLLFVKPYGSTRATCAVFCL